MIADVFETTMRTFLRRRPFEKFIVELEDGRNLIIDDPHAAGFDGGSAGYIDAEGEIRFYTYDEVRDIWGETHDQATP